MMGNDNTNPYVSPATEGEAGADLAGSYRDRGVGLILFGSFQLLIAGVCALMVPVMALAMTMSRLGKAQPNLRAVIPAVLTYAVLAAVLGTLGPMIGLLGTLKGMIAAFIVIGQSDQQVKASEVAGALSEALVLTFEGVALKTNCVWSGIHRGSIRDALGGSTTGASEASTVS